MSSSALEEFLGAGRHYKRTRGQVVQSFDGQPLIILVISGYIKRYLISNDGGLGVQSIYGPGYVFPLTAAFWSIFNQKIYHGNETYYYEAVTKAELCSVSADALAMAAQNNPELYKDILFQAGKRLESNIHQLENISLKTPSRRVAHQLAFFARHFSEPTSTGLKILVTLTHQDIGDMLSLTRETVSREIVKLREKGLLAPGKDMIITNVDALRTIYE